MNETKTNISLELLLLNDLLRAKAIDKEIYDKAAQKSYPLKKKSRLHSPVFPGNRMSSLTTMAYLGTRNEEQKQTAAQPQSQRRNVRPQKHVWSNRPHTLRGSKRNYQGV